MNEQMDSSVLEYRAGNRALWNASRKYLGIVCGSIFAIILTDPEAVRQMTIHGLPLSVIVEWYLVAGIIGVFFAELWEAIGTEIELPPPEHPMWLRKVFSVYTMVGLMIFGNMLHQILSQS